MLSSTNFRKRTVIFTLDLRFYRIKKTHDKIAFVNSFIFITVCNRYVLILWFQELRTIQQWWRLQCNLQGMLSIFIFFSKVRPNLWVKWRNEYFIVRIYLIYLQNLKHSKSINSEKQVDKLLAELVSFLILYLINSIVNNFTCFTILKFVFYINIWDWTSYYFFYLSHWIWF